MRNLLASAALCVAVFSAPAAALAQQHIGGGGGGYHGGGGFGGSRGSTSSGSYGGGYREAGSAVRGSGTGFRSQGYRGGYGRGGYYRGGYGPYYGFGFGLYDPWFYGYPYGFDAPWYGDYVGVYAPPPRDWDDERPSDAWNRDYGSSYGDDRGAGGGGGQPCGQWVWNAQANKYDWNAGACDAASAGGPQPGSAATTLRVPPNV